MYLCLMYSKELLKGTLQTIILQLLAAHGKMYGYEITQKVKALSEGEVLLTEGALYPSLHKMEAKGLLTTEKVAIGKRVRKYYHLTPAGQAAASQKVSEFQAFVESMRKILSLSDDPGLAPG